MTRGMSAWLRPGLALESSHSQNASAGCRLRASPAEVVTERLETLMAWGGGCHGMEGQRPCSAPRGTFTSHFFFLLDRPSPKTAMNVWLVSTEANRWLGSVGKSREVSPCPEDLRKSRAGVSPVTLSPVLIPSIMYKLT